MPVQKQTRAGQRTRFKAFVAIGDYNGHVGLGVKCSKEVATAIRGAIIMAKLSIVPVRRGFWGTKLGKPHTVPRKVTGKCGSIWVRLSPAPCGTDIISAPVPKKLLQVFVILIIFALTDLTLVRLISTDSCLSRLPELRSATPTPLPRAPLEL